MEHYNTYFTAINESSKSSLTTKVKHNVRPRMIIGQIPGFSLQFKTINIL